MWSQIATSNGAKGGRRYRPYVFTEHGAVMAANVLSSTVAIHASIIVVQTFIRMRTMLAEHGELKRRLQYIGKRTSPLYILLYQNRPNVSEPKRKSEMFSAVP